MIRLRNLIPWLAVAAIAFSVAYQSTSRRPAPQDQLLTVRPSAVRTDGMVQHEVTPLPVDGWLEYRISRSASRCQVLANALVSRSAATSVPPEERQSATWPYGIDLELRDDMGNVLDASTYHFRGRIPQAIDLDLNDLVFGMQMDDPSVVATSTNVMELDCEPAQDGSARRAAILRLRQGEAIPGVQRMVVRVYEQVPGLEKSGGWERLDTDDRNRICSASVYTSDLLTTAERNNMLRLLFTPAVKRNGFQTETLYVIGKPNKDEAFVPATPHNGIYSDPETDAVIAIPAGLGDFTITVFETDEAAAVRATYQSADPRDRYSGRFRCSPGEQVSVPGYGGLLQLRSDSPTYCQVHHRSRTAKANEPAIALERAKRSSAATLIDGFAIDYDIHGADIDANPIPVKFLIRVPIAESSDEGPELPRDPLVDARADEQRPIARWEFLDANGNILDAHEKPLTLTPSRLDRLLSKRESEPVSKPSQGYFLISPHVASVRVTIRGSAALVSAYLRPYDLPRKFIAQDQFTEVDQRLRSWFMLEPRDENNQLAQQRRRIEVQPRIKPRDIDLESGQYEWHQFHPSGTWIGNEAFVKLDDEPTSPTTSATVFAKITPNTDFLFRIDDVDNRDTVDPKFVFSAAAPPGIVRLFIDGDPWATYQLDTSRGSFAPEAELPREGRLRVEADTDVSLYVRGVSISDASLFRHRTLDQLNGKLRYRYRKLSHDSELVSIRYFAAHSKDGENQSDRLRLSLADEPAMEYNQLLPEWTLRSRVYELPRLAAAESVVLDNSTRLTAAAKCFFRFGEDLPPGDYTLVIETADDADHGWLLVSQTTPGKPSLRRLRRDRETRLRPRP